MDHHHSCHHVPYGLHLRSARNTPYASKTNLWIRSDDNRRVSKYFTAIKLIPVLLWLGSNTTWNDEPIPNTVLLLDVYSIGKFNRVKLPNASHRIRSVDFNFGACTANQALSVRDASCTGSIQPFNSGYLGNSYCISIQVSLRKSRLPAMGIYS